MPRTDAPDPPRRMRGFERTSTLVASQIREAGESRGFAVSKLLTHWSEVVGDDIASVARPVDVSYGRGSFGGTLTLLTTGANAPMLEMQSERIRDRVNACYGYSAITRVRVTQTAPQGFNEGRVEFEPEHKSPAQREIDSEAKSLAAEMADDVGDTGLKAALETLGGHVFSADKTKSQKGRK